MYFEPFLCLNPSHPTNSPLFASTVELSIETLLLLLIDAKALNIYPIFLLPAIFKPFPSSLYEP